MQYFLSAVRCWSDLNLCALTNPDSQQNWALVSLFEPIVLSNSHGVMAVVPNLHESSHFQLHFDHHKTEVLISWWARQDNCCVKENGLLFLHSDSYHKAATLHRKESSKWLYSQTLLPQRQHCRVHSSLKDRTGYSCSLNKKAAKVFSLPTS